MKTVLFIGTVWPEPVSSAAGVRFLQVVEAFRGWRRVFASPAKPNDFEQRLRAQGLETAHFLPNDPGFDSWVKGIRPEVVVFERFVIEEQFGWRVRAECPEAVRVLDTQDFHSLRKFREAELEASARWGSPVVPPSDERMPEDVRREVASILRSDLTLVISDFERECLAERFGVPRHQLYLHRFAFSNPPRPTRSFGERKGFGFIGNFRHRPNLDAVQWLVRDLWPAIRSQWDGMGPDLLIGGAYPPEAVMALSNPQDRVQVLGSVPDQYEFFSKIRVSLAPLRVGAGIKGKIAESWWMGTPVVTTSIGAEGMTSGLPFGGEVSDSPDEFCRLAVRMYQDEAFWSQAGLKADHLLESLYRAEVLDADLMRALEIIAADLSGWRGRCPWAQVLWSQGLRATEYFSRWIEAKNSRGSVERS